MPSHSPPSSVEPWRLFLASYEPLRPDLYRYARHLTRSPWDAEDLSQETLARAFVALGAMGEAPEHPRAWLFRIASNLWLNRVRGARELVTDDPHRTSEPSTTPAPRDAREAAGTILAELAPRERAAVVLKEAFGLSLEEIAETLSTTVGAVKSALHRGREKLATTDVGEPRAVPPEVLSRFCEAFHAADLDRLTALMLEDATLELPGIKIERGAKEIRDGSLHGTLFGCAAAGYAPPSTPRSELRHHRGEWLLLWSWDDAVQAVVRAEVLGDRIAKLVSYFHAPELLEEVCRELSVPFRTHGYWPALSSFGKASS